MRHQDLAIRLNAFRNLTHIARAMGTEKTRKQLIPYVSGRQGKRGHLRLPRMGCNKARSDLLMRLLLLLSCLFASCRLVLVENCDDDDEVLLLLAGILGGMVEEVGGVEHAAVLLTPLEQLTGADDSAVRKKSVEAITRVSAQLSDAHVTEFELPLLRRLATAEWLTSRISSAGLFHVVYPRVPEASRKELRQLFLQLCKTEETPTVKRAATEHLGEFANVIDPKLVLEELFPVLQKLAKDDQDSVRLLTVTPCVAIAKIFGKENKALNVCRQSTRTQRRAACSHSNDDAMGITLIF